MSDFLQISSYLSQQENIIQKASSEKDRTDLVRLSLKKALESAAGDQDVDTNENDELVLFAKRHSLNLPFTIPDEFTKENASTYLKQLQASEQTGFSAFLRLLKAPYAAIKQTIFSLGGHQVRDRFGYLEDPKNIDTRRFRNAERIYSDAVLTNLPGVKEIRDRLVLLRENIVSKIEDTTTTPQGVFFTRVPGAHGVSSLFFRPYSNSPEQLLVDPTSFNTDSKKYVIVNFSPSPKGNYIAVQFLINGDSKNRETKIFDLRTTPPKPIDQTVQKAVGAAAWLPDESGFVYERFPDEIKLMWKEMQVRLHLLGQDPSKDKLLIGNQSTKAPYQIESDYSPVVYTAPNSQHVIVSFTRGTDHTHSKIITTSIDELKKQTPEWKEITSLKGTRTSDFALQGDTLYIYATENPLQQSSANDLNGMIVKVSLNDSDPRISNPKTSSIFVPASDRILSPHFAAQADGLYLFEQKIALERPFRVDYANPSSRKDFDALLPDGNVGEYSIRRHLDPRMKGATFNISQWGGELLTYRFDAVSNQLTPLQLEEKPKFDSVSIASKVIYAKNEDGSPLPITLLYDKDHEPKLDGQNQMHVEGYGAYGTVYSPGWIGSALELRHRALIEKGSIVAIIHVSGGGELGDRGHQAGRLDKKINSETGFVSGIKYLHHQGYSSPSLTTVDGRSAGGFLALWSATEDQPIIAGMMMHSGVVEGLRLYQGGAGDINTPEFGDPRKSEQFDFVQASSPYARFIQGHRYPDMLYINDVRDTNVADFHFMKGIAAARASHPQNVALSMQTSCGHVYGGCEEQEVIDVEARAIAWREWVMAKNKK